MLTILSMKNQTKITPSRLRRPIAELGQRITRARTARRISQELMAERCGVSRATISKLESGDASVSADTLFRALMVLGKDDDIDKLLAKDQVGYELAVARMPRPSTKASRRANLIKVAEGDGEAASGVDAGVTQPGAKVRPKPVLKRSGIDVPTSTPATVKRKPGVVNVTRSRPTPRIKK